MALTYILLVLGFLLLIKGADWLVDGSSSIARRIGVSMLVIGLTVVSFGTSAPELVVNILASLEGTTDIAIGNVLGSNIANILLILGISSAIYPLHVSKGTVWKEIPLALLAVVVMGILANDIFFDAAGRSELTRSDGLVLLSFLVIFLYYVFAISSANRDTPRAHVRKYSLPKATLITVAGLGALVLGGKWVVDGAVAIAENWGISQSIIGLTVVAIGTSLPELATSAVATYKREADIAVGNVVGSNIFNIFWILGASSIIHPLPFSPEFARDIYVAMGATVLLFIFIFIGQKQKLERVQGMGLVALYIFYIGFLVTQAV